MSDDSILVMGPQYADQAGEIGAVGKDNEAKKLLKAHADAMSEGLRSILARPLDEERTETLDVEEVEAFVRAQGGRRRALGEDDVIVGASVRGRTARDRALSIVVEKPSGRAVPYGYDGIASSDAFAVSEDNAQRLVEARKYGGESGRAMVAQDLDARRRFGSSEDGRADAALAERAEAAEQELAERDDRIAELEARLAAAEDAPPATDGDVPTSLAAPWEGYDEQPALERAERVATVPFGDLAAVEAYENDRSRPSKRVLDAVAERRAQGDE